MTPRHRGIVASRLGRRGVGAHSIGRWTAEEGRHAIVLRDYLTVTRNVDPVALEGFIATRSCCRSSTIGGSSS
jgi:acyl-[acyl-carrier-protein] desaturase